MIFQTGDKNDSRKRRQDSNFFSKITFSYVSGLIRKGRRKELEINEYPSIEDDDDVETLSKTFMELWDKEFQEKGPKASLFAVMFSVFGKTYLLNLITYLTEASMQLLQGYYLSKLLTWFQSPTDLNEGYIIAGILGTAMVLHGALHQLEFFNSWRMGMRMKSTLIASVYTKCLRLSLANAASTGAVVNLVSNDVQKFEDAAPFVPFILVGPLQLLVSAYLIYLQIGWSVIAAMAGIIILIPVQSIFAKLFGKYRKITVKFRDECMKSISDMLSGIMVVKVYAWEVPFMSKINQERNSQMNSMWKTYKLDALNQSFFNTSAVFSNCITFSTYYLAGGILTPAQVFSVITYMQHLKLLMTLFFPLAMQFVSECAVSLDRIHKFLILEEIVDSREKKASSDNNMKVCIEIKDAYISWSKEESKFENLPVLKNINFKAEKGDLIAVCGPVGSGKSSFLLSILGDTILKSGQMYRSTSKIGYVSQSAWILSGTIKENILFGSAYEPKRFQQVIEVCCLDKDLSLFKDKENTIIGERGVTLSGGQKARVSLARACYAQVELYILDDPLSAVDAKVARQIFEKCIKGVLSSKTVILVTHQLQFIQDCSKIVLIENGEITESGSFSDIISSNSSFAKTVKEYNSTHNFDSKEVLENNVEMNLQDLDDSRVEAYEKNEFTKEEKVIGNVSFSAYIRYLISGSSYRGLIFLSMVFVFGQVFAVGFDVWLAKWSSFSADDQRNNGYLAIFIGIGLVTIGLAIVRTIYFFSLAYKSNMRAFSEMLTAVFFSPLSFFQGIPHGRLMNRFAKDMSTMDEVLPRTCYDFLQCSFVSITIFILAGVLVPYVFILMPFIGAYFYYLRTCYVQTSRQIKRLESLTRSPVYSSIPSTLEGLTIIRAFGASQRFLKQFYLHQNENIRFFFLYMSCGRWLGFRLDMLSGLFAAAITFSCILCIDIFKISPSIVGLLLSYLMQLTGLLQWAVRQSSEVENMMVSAERVYEYTNLKPEAPHELDFKPPKEWPSKGEIRINEMSLAYPDLTTPGKLNDPVLKNITIEFEPAQKIGIVGRTGAGKSSFLQALFRLVEPSPERSIIIDDIATSDLGLNDLRSRISIIPQEPFCFKGSLRFNLDPFGLYSDDQLWQALGAVELKKTVEAIPDKLEAPVAENGANWSIGERQLICLARAILRNSRIIVMDEATSSVDMHTDALIQKAIRSEGGLFLNSTVITIAHRLNTVIDYDRILVLDEGRVVEFGIPSELIEKDINEAGSYFARMVHEMGSKAEETLRKFAKFEQK